MFFSLNTVDISPDPFGSVISCKSVSRMSENCINTKVKSDLTPTPLCAPCTPMSSYVKTKHLPVYHLTIGALGGAGFESFEVNLSWEICITGARCNHRLKINCFALLQTSFWLRIREWTFCNACCQLYTHLHTRTLRKSGKYYTFTFLCGYKNTDAYKLQMQLHTYTFTDV